MDGFLTISANWQYVLVLVYTANLLFLLTRSSLIPLSVLPPYPHILLGDLAVLIPTPYYPGNILVQTIHGILVHDHTSGVSGPCHRVEYLSHYPCITASRAPCLDEGTLRCFQLSSK